MYTNIHKTTIEYDRKKNIYFHKILLKHVSINA